MNPFVLTRRADVFREQGFLAGMSVPINGTVLIDVALVLNNDPLLDELAKIDIRFRRSLSNADRDQLLQSEINLSISAPSDSVFIDPDVVIIDKRLSIYHRPVSSKLR